MAFTPLPPSTYPDLTGAEIPPRPKSFTVDGVPDHPAFSADLSAFKDANGGDWWRSRPIIKPRIGVVHTNAASVEASIQSQINWGNAAPYANTHPHWCVNDGRAVRMVPANRRSIANSTPASAEIAAGVDDSSFWTTSIETRDSGTNADPAVSDFLGYDAELVAMILAYDSLIPGQEYPIQIPLTWTGTGVVTHTWPHDGVYTTRAGKICPGTKKKSTFRDVIVPRAAQIRAAWLNPPDEGELEMSEATDLLKEILAEQRILRAEVEKVTAHTYKTQWRLYHLNKRTIRHVTESKSIDQRLSNLNGRVQRQSEDVEALREVFAPED